MLRLVMYRQRHKQPAGPVAIARVLSEHPLLHQALTKSTTDNILAQHLRTHIPVTRHCTGFNPDKENKEIVLYVASATWAQRLLMEKHNIINELQKIPGFSWVCTVRFVISPSTAARGINSVPTRSRRRYCHPPPEVASTLRCAAELAIVPAVRRALLRLARRAESGGGQDVGN